MQMTSGMTTKQMLIAIAIMSVITIALRYIPFLVFSGKETPKAVVYFGKALPFAVIGMLVVYCMKDLTFSSLEGWLPALIASAVTVVSYLIKKNTLISIVLGTLSYMALVQFVFV